MNIRLPIIALIGAAVFLFASNLHAQDDETTLPPASDGEENSTEEPEIRAGQEVEINEDNYRQFMELKDPTLQREIIPENAFKPGSGLQKLDNLPEESQKHLRNQLREIIVQGDPWQPGDEETEYPYTPSEAASNNPALEKDEQEAWGELVDSYHDREAQIYENSSGSQAARGAEQGSSNSQQSGQGSPGGGQEGEGSEGQQAGQEGNQNQSQTEGTYSVNGSGNPDSKSTAGVSQNAMEFLQGLGKGGGNTGQDTGQGSQGDSTEGDGPGGNSATPSEAQSQAQAGQQGSAASGRQQPPGGMTEGESTAGTSQSAMEYLQGLGEGSGDSDEAVAESTPGQNTTGTSPFPSDGQLSSQGGEQQSTTPGSMANSGQAASEQASNEPATEGTSQNAMEFLKGMSAGGDTQNGSDDGSSTSTGSQSGSADSNQGGSQAGGQQDGQQNGQDQGQEASQASSQEAGQESAQGESQGETQGDEQADSQDEGQLQDSQQTETRQETDSAESPSNSAPLSPTETEEESTEGAAQNALEYLTGDSVQSSDATGAEGETTGETEGTLTIQDLLNAQGVGVEITSPNSERPADGTKPDKDGDG